MYMFAFYSNSIKCMKGRKILVSINSLTERKNEEKSNFDHLLYISEKAKAYLIKFGV